MKFISLFILLFIIGIPNQTNGQFRQLDQMEIEEMLEGEAFEVNIEKLSLGDLWILRNYIFAKKGYRFRNSYLQELYDRNFRMLGDLDKVELTSREKDIVSKIRMREEKLSEDLRQTIIGKDTFEIRNGYLISTLIQLREEPHKIDQSIKTISCDTLDNNLYLIKMHSAYFIDDIECCLGDMWAINQVVEQYVFNSETRKLVVVPKHITKGKVVDKLIDHKYLIVTSKPISGPPIFELYNLESFQLVISFDEVAGYDIQGSTKIPEIIIREITDKNVEYPYKYIRENVFKEGHLIKGKEEKTELYWYFAG
ncbi:YARHG domain-containing protein [Flammeovirga kamogawensis]|uniref:YARHG domain-containing protein n=1 Tax=Flammeovirga kamogawensis TaxID=373891 RepID=UPI0011826683|nr:YARHG domain-containing protein [Flammeovirga kamogawensis]MBB6464105.1 hypothetical protein [Flammeovirga kamogawensis]TRX65417.1 YARHG domain-containing protein [Flammeovirga kamogawensis]